uniref:Secreted peptide n=1 Tax=Heterorhabditis bacteriophora TaxID=37862 RepID=A0A1I7XA17_HETBA
MLLPIIFLYMSVLISTVMSCAGLFGGGGGGGTCCCCKHLISGGSSSFYKLIFAVIYKRLFSKF